MQKYWWLKVGWPCLLLIGSTSLSLGDTRPNAWCGWWLRHELGVNDPSYNLARTWYKYGNQTKPQIGAIVVWPHHVGLVVGMTPAGKWLIRSGNDGGRVKTRVWPLNGARFRI